MKSKIVFQVLVIGFVILSLQSCCFHRVSKTEKADLLILHTNDTHSYIAGIDKNGNACIDDTNCKGGFARISQRIKDIQKRRENTIVLDAGDMFTGTLFFSINKWKLQSELNEILPYDAITLGNHEWDLGCTELSSYIDNNSIPVLAANLSPQTGCPLLRSHYKPYLIVKRGNEKVGIIGLANDEVSGLANACKYTGFTDRVSAVNRCVEKLELQGVKRIILLTHIGLQEDIELAKHLHGVDVIVGGHSHSYLGDTSSEGKYPIVEKSLSGEPILIVTAGKTTQYLGELYCFFDNNGSLRKWYGESHEILQSEKRDKRVSEIIKGYSKQLKDLTSQIIGKHTLRLGEDGIEACRKGDCLTGMIITDALLDFGEEYGAEVALFNSGGIRGSFSETITTGDILNVLPFEERIVIIEMTGRQIHEALEHGVSESTVSSPRLLHPAGLRYYVNKSNPVGKRIIKIELLKDNEVYQIQPQKKYLVVTTRYLQNGGDFFSSFKEGKDYPIVRVRDFDIISNYLRRHSPIQTIRTRRILKASNI